jgi:tetratricopeptide (TPR) repeat protein
VAAESLLSLGFDVNKRVSGKTAADLAWEGDHQDTLLFLLQNNSQFPSNFDHKMAKGELWGFCKMTILFMEYIRQGKVKRIEKIIDENSNLTYFYNFDNSSALSVAIQNGRLEVYKSLMRKKVKYSPDENIQSIIGELSEKEGKKLQKIHDSTASNQSQSHITTLILHSYCSEDGANVKNKFDYVAQAFEYLDQIYFVQVILRVVASFKNFKIIFDFDHDSTYYLDPKTEESCRGLFYTTGTIYIGAKDLLSREMRRRVKVYATLAHELCHFAMYIIYRNNSKPYRESDQERKFKFQDVYGHCFQNKEHDDVVKFAFDEMYDPHRKIAELIARVPHMATLYHDNSEREQEVMDVYKPLFDYYREHVVDDMEREMPGIEREAKEQVEKKIKKKKMITKGAKLAAGILSIVIASACIGYFIAGSPECQDQVNNNQQSFDKNDAASELNSKGLIDLKNKNYVDAARKFEAAYELTDDDHPDKVLYRENAKKAQVQKDSDQVGTEKAEQPDDVKFNEIIDNAFALIDDQNFSEAKVKLNEASKFVKSDDYPEFEKLLKFVEAQNFNSECVFLNEARKYKEAIEKCLQALNTSDSNLFYENLSVAYRNFGESLNKQRDFENAENQFSLAANALKNDSESYDEYLGNINYLRSKNYNDLGIKNLIDGFYTQGLSYFLDALAITPPELVENTERYKENALRSIYELLKEDKPFDKVYEIYENAARNLSKIVKPDKDQIGI